MNKTEVVEKFKKKIIKIPHLKIRNSRNINSNLYKNTNSDKKHSKEDNIYENETFFTQEKDKEKAIKRLGNEIRKFENIYSPRTTFVKNQEKEEKLFRELCNAFDPITIKIMKSFFKERLGELSKQNFIELLQKNLLTWRPELPDRENILAKFLSKIFDDVDLNNNNKMDWDEFTEFIISASDNKNNKKNYEYKYFIPMKKIIDDSEFADIVSHAFYISKYNLIGIAIEGKSCIYFYDADTCKKQKTFIDIKETQQKIDKMKYKELEQRAKEELIRKEEEIRVKLRNLQKIKNVSINFNESSLVKNKKSFIDDSENLFKTSYNKQNRDNTPEKLKHELEIINADYFKINKKDFNKKLTILCTVFVEEYDTLFISSSNNKISAWKYEDGQFKNVNKTEGEVKDKDVFSCAILDAELPKQTIDWDQEQKYLYSGQADGKILMWDINRTKNIENGTLDYAKAKERHEDDLEKHRIINVDEIEVNEDNIDNVDEEKIKTYLNQLTQNNNNSSIFKSKKNKSTDRPKKIKLFNDKLLINNKMDVSIDSVSCLKVLGKMKMIAAGYYNGSVILWDTMLREHRKFYTDQKTGIYQIEYDIIKNLIFTCGFDHDIYIYDPYVDGRCIYKLTGHNYSINSIACINPENEFVSIDIYGNIKIWDLTNFYNYQTINLNETLNLIKIQNNQTQIKKKISSNQKMIFLNKAKKILTFGEKLMMFGMVKAKLTDLCDTQLVLGCFYKSSKFCFYTVCLKKIKIWNMFNGKLKEVYDNFLPNPHSEITSFCTDLAIKRIYIGDCFGNILNININNGKILKKFDSHNAEIVSMCHSTKSNILISLSSDSLIKFHKDKDFEEINTLKEFTLDNIPIKTIKLNETYSRIIIGTSKGELKYFDIEHLRQDSSSGKEKEKKIRSEDPINEVYSFEEFPICISFHESSLANFEIIPPTFYKFRTFGEFNNIINKDGNEIKVKIVSSDFDKVNKRLFTADYFGYVQCYSLKELFDILKNINMINGSNEDSKYIQMLGNYKIEKLFCFEAHKEKIKQIQYPDINPNIIITTGNDRRVKLFSAEDGTYIDEFMQSSDNLREYPIGLRYYYSDPFVSKIDTDEKIKSDTVFRKDIVGFKMNKFNKELLQMKKEYKPLNEYLLSLIDLNAKERLYLITKNVELPLDKSSNWRYNPNLEEIISNEKEYYDFNKKQKKKRKFNFTPIDSKYYYPKFIKEMNDQQLKDFSNTLNNKIRKMKLTMAKYQLNSERFKDYEKEEKKKIRNISYKDEMKKLFGKSLDKKEIISPRLEQLNTERAYKFGIVKTYKNIEERFDNYKSDFNMRLNDLENTVETKLINRFTYSQKFNNSRDSKNKNKNKIRINKYNIKKILEDYKIKSSNKSILPTINNTGSVNNLKNIRIKKNVDFNLKNKRCLTFRNEINNSIE